MPTLEEQIDETEAITKRRREKAFAILKTAAATNRQIAAIIYLLDPREFAEIEKLPTQ